jgi:hypothetical protein
MSETNGRRDDDDMSKMAGDTSNAKLSFDSHSVRQLQRRTAPKAISGSAAGSHSSVSFCIAMEMQ